MALSGEQWLEDYFRPRVAAVRQPGADEATPESLRLLGGRLWSQVEALADTGTLSDEQERAALDLLREAQLMPKISSKSVSVSSTASFTPVIAADNPTVAIPRPEPVPAPPAPPARTPASAPAPASTPLPPAVVTTAHAATPPPQHGVWSTPPRLLGVLAGPRVLGQFEGHPVTLVSAELWNNRIVVDLYTGTSEQYRRARQEGAREHLAWHTRRRRGVTGEPAPRQPSPPLQAVRWDLHDEHETAYTRSGGQGEFSDHLDRARLQWYPAPPPGVRKLRLVATDPQGAVVFACMVPVPQDSTGDAAVR